MEIILLMLEILQARVSPQRSLVSPKNGFSVPAAIKAKQYKHDERPHRSVIRMTKGPQEETQWKSKGIWDDYPGGKDAGR